MTKPKVWTKAEVLEEIRRREDHFHAAEKEALKAKRYVRVRECRTAFEQLESIAALVQRMRGK